MNEERTVEKITVWRTVAVRIGRKSLRKRVMLRWSGKNEDSELE